MVLTNPWFLRPWLSIVARRNVIFHVCGTRVALPCSTATTIVLVHFKRYCGTRRLWRTHSLVAPCRCNHRHHLWHAPLWHCLLCDARVAWSTSATMVFTTKKLFCWRFMYAPLNNTPQNPLPCHASHAANMRTDHGQMRLP